MTLLLDEVGKESVNRLLKKEKDINIFIKCVDILDKYVLISWPLSWTNRCAYSFEYDSSFLAMSANNLSLNTLDLLYFPHEQEEICIYRGLFNDCYRFISNPHYFAETFIRTFFHLDVYIHTTLVSQSHNNSY